MRPILPSRSGGIRKLRGATPWPGTGDGSVSAGNAAGVLSYCVKNKLLGGTDATSVLGGLTKKPDVAGSDDFKVGETGMLKTGDNSSLSLDCATGKMKSKACNMVLKHAKSLI